MHNNSSAGSFENLDYGKFIARKGRSPNLIDIALLPPGLVCFAESRSGKTAIAASIILLSLDSRSKFRQ